MKLLSSFVRPLTTSFALATQHASPGRIHQQGIGSAFGIKRTLAINSSSSLRASSSTNTYTTHSSVTPELIDQYDAFILDQFGVLHNGATALDGAVALTEHLKALGKKLIVLSNTSAPSEKALEKLPKYGFNPQHFVDAVTSGEEALKYINQELTNTKALMMTWDASDPSNPRLTAMPQLFLDRMETVELATSVDEADWLVLHGTEVWWKGGNDNVDLQFINDGNMEAVVEPFLQQCAARNLPAVCANPDIIVLTPDGGKAYMPGTIAKRYEELGGHVEWFGKPEVRHFRACLETLGIAPDRVCHVGDSLHHDIKGANEAGIANIFVTSGIHRGDFGTEFGELPEDPQLSDLFAQEGNIVPTHVVPAFRQ